MAHRPLDFPYPEHGDPMWTHWQKMERRIKALEARVKALETPPAPPGYHRDRDGFMRSNGSGL